MLVFQNRRINNNCVAIQIITKKDIFLFRTYFMKIVLTKLGGWHHKTAENFYHKWFCFVQKDIGTISTEKKIVLSQNINHLSKSKKYLSCAYFSQILEYNSSQYWYQSQTLHYQVEPIAYFWHLQWRIWLVQ